MDEGSIVGAATHLGVTQSAVSKHLAQLRDWFADPLFVRTREGMLPTPNALQIIGQAERVLMEANKLMAVRPEAPAEFTGALTLSATDEVLSHIAGRLHDKMSHETPNLRLTCLPLSPDYSVRQLETGKVNLLVAVNWHSPMHLKQKLLFRDTFACVMHKDHPLAGETLTLKNYAGARHVLVAPLGHEVGHVDQELAKSGLSRNVSISVPNFGLLTPSLLAKDGLVTLPLQVAQNMISRSDLVVRQPPLDLGQVNYFALWHERFDLDPKLSWMRAAVAEIYANGAKGR